MGADYGAPYGHWLWGNFWSGFAPNLAILGAAGGAYNKHNCHVPRCWRIGRHHVNGTPWCNKHHGAARVKEGDHA
jgi:hypothetical protein